jgi:hypothetical protein
MNCDELKGLDSICLDIFCYSNIYLKKIYQILIEEEVVKREFEIEGMGDRAKRIYRG